MRNYILLWLPMVGLAVLNGAIRDLGYGKHLSGLMANQLSTLLLLLLLGIYISFVIRKYPPHSAVQALLIGTVWMVLTLAFELGFGLYRGATGAQLLDAYKINKGQLWVLVPLWLVAAPYLFFKMQDRIA